MKFGELFLLQISVFLAESAPETTTTEPTEKKSLAKLNTKLRRSLLVLGDYDRKVIPDNVTVRFGATLMNLEVGVENRVMDSGIWLTYDWNDTRLSWNPEYFEGLEKIVFYADEIWRPDITLYNSLRSEMGFENQMNCGKTRIYGKSNGEQSHISHCHLKTFCKMDLEKVNQTCQLKFGSWVYHGNELDLELSMDAMDLGSVTGVEGIKILNSTAFKNTLQYACCPESYVDLTYNLIFQLKEKDPKEEKFETKTEQFPTTEDPLDRMRNSLISLTGSLGHDDDW